MSATAKALALLSHFSPERPEIGLSQLCRLAVRDKATTFRHMQALEQEGLVERNPVTRQYRLGPNLLRLAAMRERTVPRKAAAETVLRDLANATGETAHVTVLSGTTLFKLAAVEAQTHSLRVIADLDTFPLHATASGIAALAFGPEALQAALPATLTAFTPRTPDNPATLRAEVTRARQTGFGECNRGYEEDVHSLSAPVFDQSGALAGTIAVAAVATRMTPVLEAKIRTALATASRNLTRHWGGTIPAEIETAWARTQPAAVKEDAAS